MAVSLCCTTWEAHCASLWQLHYSQSCPILCDPMDYSPPGSSAQGIFQAKILERVAISYSEDCLNPGIEPTSLVSHISCTGKQIIYHLAPPGEKAVAPHSSTLAWKIHGEEPGRLQSMGSRRVGHN